MPKQRGRTAGFTMTQEHRDKIAKSNILHRLMQYCEGDETVDMAPQQVTASLALLKKVMPDLQPIDGDTGKAGLSIHLSKDTDKL